MKIDENKVTLDQVLTVGEFVNKLKQRTGNDKITYSTIHYHITETDNLDWCERGGMKFIVMNDKADKFTIGEFHGKNRTMKKIKL